MDIYTLIRNDHNKAKETMNRIRTLSDHQHEERMRLFYPLKEELMTHNDSEEETFYVALQEHSETSKDAKHSTHEHHEAADLLDKLSDEKMEPAQWSALYNKLYDALLHHMTEEEGRIFADAQKVLSNETAALLADEMTRLKKKHQPMSKKADEREHGAYRH